MEERIQKLFDTVGDLRRKANVNTAFGKPVAAEGRTVIPVAEVGYVFGLRFGTSGEGQEPQPEEGSAGGRLSTRPLGLIEVAEEGITVQPVVDEQRVALAGALLAGWIVFWVARTLVRIFAKR